MADIDFTIGLDIEELNAKLQDAKSRFEAMSKEAIENGKQIDNVFNYLGAIGNFDVSRIEGKLNALRSAISDSSNDIIRYSEVIEKLKADASAAMISGDMSAFEKTTQEIDKYQKELAQANRDLEVYKALLEEVNRVSGKQPQRDVQQNLFYVSEKDYQNVKKMEEHLASLQSQLSRVQSDKEFAKLNAEIIKTEASLNAAKDKAQDAANALGDKLGGQAAKATTKLYELNDQIDKQYKEYEDLRKAVAECEKELRKLNSVPEKKKDYESIRAKQLEYQELSKSMNNAGNALEKLNAQQRDAKNEADKFNGSMQKLLGGTKQYSDIMSSLPAPIASAVSGLKRMVTAAKAFIATPLGAVIAAITGALLAVKKALNSSVEGQQAMARASGYLQGVLASLMKIVINVGNALINAFTKPKETWNKLLDSLKKGGEFLGKMFSSIGNIIKAAFTFKFDELKAEAQNFKNLFADTFGGIIDGIGDTVKGMNEMGKKMADIAEARKKLEYEESNFAKILPTLQEKESKLMMEMRDSSKSVEERKNAEVEYEKVVNRIYNTQIGFAQRRLGLFEKEWKGRTKNYDVLIEQNELEANINRLNAQKQQQLTSLQRMRNSIYRAENKEETEAERAAAAELKLRRDQEQQEINLMKEGLTKKLRQIDFNYKKEIDRIEENAKKMKKAAEGGVLTSEQEQSIKDAKDSAQRLNAKEKQDAIDKELSAYLTYEQQRAKIAKEYNDKIKDLEANGASNENIANVIKEANKAIGELDAKKFRESSDYVKFFSANLTLASDDLRSIANTIKDNLNRQLQDGVISISDYAKAWDEVEEKLHENENVSNNFFTFMKEGLDGVIEKTRRLAEQQRLAAIAEERDAQDEVDRLIGEGKDPNGTEMKAAIMRRDAAKLDKKSAEMNLEAAEKNKAAVKKATELAEIISGAVNVASTTYDTFKDVANSFGMDTDAKFFDYANVAMDTIDGAGKAVSQFLSGDVLGSISTMIDTIGNLVIGLNEANDKELERSIEQHKNNISQLQNAYAELDKAVSKAYGTDKMRLIKDQEANLRKQVQELEKARADEEEKKKTDEDSVEQYNENIKANIEAIEELKQAELDALFGDDVQSAISNLADAIVNAWEQGKNAAFSLDDFANSMMRNLIKQMIMEAVTGSKIIEKLRKKIQESLFETDKIKTWSRDIVFGDHIKDVEQDVLDDIHGFSQGLANELEGEIEPLRRLLEMVGEDSGRSAVATGIAQASQDSVDELNGRATAIQGHTYSISQNTQLLLVCTNSILDTVMGIDRKFDTLNGNVAYIKSSIEDFNYNGIQLR